VYQTVIYCKFLLLYLFSKMVTHHNAKAHCTNVYRHPFSISMINKKLVKGYEMAIKQVELHPGYPVNLCYECKYLYGG
jgi:hypothetical protein